MIAPKVTPPPAETQVKANRALTNESTNYTRGSHQYGRYIHAVRRANKGSRLQQMSGNNRRIIPLLPVRCFYFAPSITLCPGSLPSLLSAALHSGVTGKISLRVLNIARTGSSDCLILPSAYMYVQTSMGGIHLPDDRQASEPDYPAAACHEGET